MIRKMGWSDNKVGATKANKNSINPSIASDNVPELPDHFFTQKLNLVNVTTIKQRLNNPAVQPFTINNLYPQHKSLSIKRSLRCRHCEHNVIKPEFNPISIKYRIQLFASYHMPEVRLMNNCAALEAGVPAKFYLKIINPTIHDMTITIMDLPTQEEEKLLIDELRKKNDKHTSLSTSLNLGASFSRQASLNEEPKFVDSKVSQSIVISSTIFFITFCYFRLTRLLVI